jgi:hypothetical protein
VPIIFKSKLSSAVANATFLDKTIDDIKKGKLSLYKTSLVEPLFIDDVQASLWKCFDVVGIAGEFDANALIYATNNYLTDGQTHKESLEAFDVAIKNVEDIVLGGAFKDVTYVDDAAYEAFYGVPVGGEHYYNSTDGTIRFYDGVAAEWKEVGGGVITNQQRLGIGNGVTVNFSVSTVPLNDESISVYLNGLRVEKTEYSVSSTLITFSTAPAIGQIVYASWLTTGTPVTPPVPSGTFQVEYHTVTALEITNKEFTLSLTPSDPTKVLVDLVNGSTQVYSVDFSITVNVLGWNGLGLDGTIIAGDILRVVYFT